jgi:GNAT superfamily N-acetyltransferase
VASTVIRQVERRAITAWPAETAREQEGWLLRHTPGVLRRRSNSAVPPLTGAPAVSAVIDVVEPFYRERNRPVFVQMSTAEEHRELDAFLERRGYERAAPTMMLTAMTADVIAATTSPADVIAATPPSVAELAERDAWVKIFTALDEHTDSAAVAEKVISRVVEPAAFVNVSREGLPAGMGLFAADSGWAGVFCMATRPELRGRGIASAILGTGARWAARNDAHRLYLQVEADNDAARALYERAGFSRSHGYHYRVAP